MLGRQELLKKTARERVVIAAKSANYYQVPIDEMLKAVAEEFVFAQEYEGQVPTLSIDQEYQLLKGIADDLVYDADADGCNAYDYRLKEVK